MFLSEAEVVEVDIVTVGERKGAPQWPKQLQSKILVEENVVLYKINKSINIWEVVFVGWIMEHGVEVGDLFEPIINCFYGAVFYFVWVYY